MGARVGGKLTEGEQRRTPPMPRSAMVFEKLERSPRRCLKYTADLPEVLPNQTAGPFRWDTFEYLSGVVNEVTFKIRRTRP